MTMSLNFPWAVANSFISGKDDAPFSEPDPSSSSLWHPSLVPEDAAVLGTTKESKVAKSAVALHGGCGAGRRYCCVTVQSD